MRRRSQNQRLSASPTDFADSRGRRICYSARLHALRRPAKARSGAPRRRLASGLAARLSRPPLHLGNDRLVVVFLHHAHEDAVRERAHEALIQQLLPPIAQEVDGHCCIERFRECLAVNLAAGGAQPPQGVSFVTTWAALMVPVWDMSRRVDRKICCVGLTRWLNATVPSGAVALDPLVTADAAGHLGCSWADHVRIARASAALNLITYFDRFFADGAGAVVPRLESLRLMIHGDSFPLTRGAVRLAGRVSVDSRIIAQRMAWRRAGNTCLPLSCTRRSRRVHQTRSDRCTNVLRQGTRARGACRGDDGSGTGLPARH